jgi:hypothetical protein
MFMPKNSRRESATKPAPLIAFDEVAVEKESFRLSWTVLANIREYAAYVKDVTGKETTPDEVADKALQRLFDADKGFRHWLQKKNGAHRSRAKNVKAEKAEKPVIDGNVEASVRAIPKV